MPLDLTKVFQGILLFFVLACDCSFSIASAFTSRRAADGLFEAICHPSSNVASLTLAHVTARSGELALRRAIGATRWDLARLVLAEITIMNAIGAAFAVVLGAWFLPALLAIAPATTRVLGEVRMDWRVAIYAMGCAVLASIGAGVVPAITASDSAAINASATRSTGSRDRQRWRALLLATQTALCVALLVVGGLLIRAVGESPASAHAIGYHVIGIRYLAVLFGGAMSGLAGAYLSLAITPMWVEGMTAGRGWIALALVVFASWRPGRLVAGAYLFGAVTILQLHAQGAGLGIPPQLMSSLPYLATIIVLVAISRVRGTAGSAAPASLGLAFVPDR